MKNARRYISVVLGVLCFESALLHNILEGNVLEAQGTPVSLSASQVAQIMAETPEISNVAISPNGAWVTYKVTRKSVATNDRKEEVLLQRLPEKAGVARASLRAPITLPAGATGVRWCPNSSCLSMVLGKNLNKELSKDATGSAKDSSRPQGLVRYDIATGRLDAIPIRDTSQSTGTIGRRPRISTISGLYDWSPSGKFITFTSELAKRDIILDQRHGVVVKQIEADTHNGLFLLEVSTGIITQLSPDSLNVSGSASWSPDERSLAVCITVPGHEWYTSSDIVVIDRLGKTVRSLVRRPGMDCSPHWSPDGKWIAFATTNGDYNYQIQWPGAVSADGKQIISFSKESTPSTPVLNAWWVPDGSAFFFTGQSDMTNRFVRAQIPKHTSENKSEAAINIINHPRSPESLVNHLPHDDNVDLSVDSRVMVYTRESLTKPAELFVVYLDGTGKSVGTPVQLTHLVPEFPLGKLVRTDTISWPSKDRKYTIHSLLLTPVSAWSKGRINTPLPTLVAYRGGPGMVRRGFGGDGWKGAELALAARGYAILVPNTRGRGGYGEKDANGIRDSRTYVGMPREDGEAGLDMLIKQGIVDSTRLGVLGHSYGGDLTKYTVTKTHRFKGAVEHEGPLYTLFSHTSLPDPIPSTLHSILNRDLAGVHNLFDPAELSRLIDESPILHVNKVKTPILMIHGSFRESLNQENRAFLVAFRRFNVPSALFVYDENHSFVRPAAIMDDITRTGEWLDYWVRGIPYPNAERAKEYNSWKQAGQSLGDG